MIKWQNIIQNNTVRFLDYSQHIPLNEQAHPAILSFAIDDTLTTSVGENKSPSTIRLWVHDQTVVLGIPDTKLPYIEEGLQYIKNKQFYPIVRNSGGLAVALDKGVLNISLIFPNSETTSIHTSYEMMFNFVEEILKDYTTNIKAYEIVGSYCPGDYDLSIDGIKFAGISQRRIKNGVSVQIYIDVCGNSEERANLIKHFYNISRKNEETLYEYPNVNPAVMGSLSELLNRSITIDEVINNIKHSMVEKKYHIVHTPFSESEFNVYHKRLNQMIKRNDIVI